MKQVEFNHIKEARNKNEAYEKAKYLCHHLYTLEYKYHTKSGIAMTDQLSKETAKQLALVVVNEILNEPKMKFCGDGVNDVFYKFWEEVKRQIEII